MKQISAILFFTFIAIVLFAVPHTSNAQGKPDGFPEQAFAHIPVCPPGEPSENARCHARVIVNEKGAPNVSTGPVGYGPLQFQTAYNVQNATSSGRILAIVDAYDHPNVKSDLDFYSDQFGLSVLP